MFTPCTLCVLYFSALWLSNVFVYSIKWTPGIPFEHCHLNPLPMLEGLPHYEAEPTPHYKIARCFHSQTYCIIGMGPGPRLCPRDSSQQRPFDQCWPSSRAWTWWQQERCLYWISSVSFPELFWGLHKLETQFSSPPGDSVGNL